MCETDESFYASLCGLLFKIPFRVYVLAGENYFL